MGGLNPAEKRNSDLAREIYRSEWQTGMELARHLRGVSRTELAQRLGVDVRQVLLWESCTDIDVPAHVLRAAGLALQVSPEFIDNTDTRCRPSVLFACQRSGPGKGVTVWRDGIPGEGECYNCGEAAPYLCDGDKGNGRTCDRDLCDVCATQTARNRHLCPDCYDASGRSKQGQLFGW